MFVQRLEIGDFFSLLAVLEVFLFSHPSLFYHILRPPFPPPDGRRRRKRGREMVKEERERDGEGEGERR